MFGKKIFSQTHSNKAGNGFENSKALSNRVLITVTASIFEI